MDLDSFGTRTISVVMVTAQFRLHGDLKLFLPRPLRHSQMQRICARAATVEHMIEALGVPHTEVISVLVNGESCGFDRLLRDGDTVDAFPPHMACNPVRLSLPHGLPPAAPRFVADLHLGALARLLRMAGFDTLFETDYADAHIAALAAREDRIVLTRDRDLLKRRLIAHGCYVRALKAPAQFSQLCARLDLRSHARPFTLCLHCNTPLRTVAKDAVEARLPPAVRRVHTSFRTCDGCHRIFWEGSHWTRMRDALLAVGIS